MQQLRSTDKSYLLGVARSAIAEELGIDVAAPAGRRIPSGSGVFVTLTKGGALRGCIGCFESHGDMTQTITHIARDAAFNDPRFPPLSAEEFAAVAIEVSVLSVPRKTSYAALVTLFPSRPGVILRKGRCSATFLPQVWEELPDPQQFMAHLCIKAGLCQDEWQASGVTFETYTVEKFVED